MPKRKIESDDNAVDVTRSESSERWSKSKKKRMRRHKAKAVAAGRGDGGDNVAASTTPSTEKVASKCSPKSDGVSEMTRSSDGASGASTLQKSFKDRLSGSRFRILNEELYTTASSSAFQRFSSTPELYHQYHEGFRYQVGRWPVNPVDVIVRNLRERAAKRHPKSAASPPLVVADFGCGDAELARQLLALNRNGKRSFVVHSFDLVASSALVTACDMANVPLESHSVDVGVFCLSLMGTNLADFIREAHRVLKEDGTVIIAEVRSRFESRDGRNDEFQEFIGVLSQLGFDCSKEDKSNKMFLLLELKKNGTAPDSKVSFTAKPCIYKRR
jgi:ribosomal RNA-processing protein 8